MKKIIPFLGLLIFSSTAIPADVYIRAVQRFEGRYHHGSFQPEYDLVHEFWFGNNCLTILRQGYQNYEGYPVEPALRLTLDQQKQRVIAVNYHESTFVDIPMPMNLHAALDSSLLDIVNNYRIDGTVQQTGKKKTIDRRVCAEFKVTEAIAYGDDRFYERDRAIMATQDVPFDWRLLDELYQWIRSFFNPQQSYLADLRKINGFIYASEDVRFQEGQQIKSSFIVLEMSEKKSPENIFDLPVDLKKKTKLIREDLIAMRGIAYLMGW